MRHKVNYLHSTQEQRLLGWGARCSPRVTTGCPRSLPHDWQAAVFIRLVDTWLNLEGCTSY